jgi:hypothetical protein
MQILKSQLFVDTFSQSIQHTFLDYLTGGCELNFMVAIDFTGIRLCNQLVYGTWKFLCPDWIIFSIKNKWNAIFF